MPGFDPRPPETYWGLFRRESRITAARRGHAIAVSDPVRSEDGLSLDWTIDFDAARTRYSLLRWDDIVGARFPRSNWRRLRDVPALWWRLRRVGYIRRFQQEARRFATVILGVHWIFLALALLSLALASVAMAALPGATRPWSLLAIPVVAYAILGVIMAVTRGKPLYVAHLVDDTTFTHDHASGAEMRMHARLDAFAERIRAAEATASELVLIGHSSSSFLAIEALDRILALDPGFGRRGTPVSLVTIGSVIPWIALDPQAEQVRRALARVAQAEAIGWLDVRADWDWLSIHLRDPLSACGIPSPGPDRPAVIRVRIEDLIDAELLARRRWNLFQMHFQLLMSSRDPEAFDYIVFVAGPEPVDAMIARNCRPKFAEDARKRNAVASTVS
ncbi:hydrolase [Methylobacterium planeticum]|uniref:Hydrolase n=1 Tax=Methylobacterium planeticum TaxID=2615211 RepID=A0A6N6MVN8_9HYPH|nr:hydrolase [Methylobacterium planeticum]KAB1074776.1 hydrolase [Methylobacterium planeticum]